MMPICQDTGMVFVYITIGQEVHIDGDLKAAINEGVRQGYQEGYLENQLLVIHCLIELIQKITHQQLFILILLWVMNLKS